MNKRIDLTNLGGFPFTQDTLKFMQESYRGAFGGLAAMIGNKTIVSGVEVSGGNVSDGWICYQNELIPFIGGVAGTDVIITENSTNAIFEDGSVFPAYYVKTATCGVGGAFLFADLVRLQTLQNIWLPGDIKEKYCDATYIANNFDVDGYGLNKEKGWRILSKVYPASAGKVMVNLDTSDADFNTIGKTGGEKTHQLTVPELPSHNHPIPRGDAYTGSAYQADMRVGGGQGANPQSSPNTGNAGGNTAHNNMQPYFVILKLIKL